MFRAAIDKNEKGKRNQKVGSVDPGLVTDSFSKHYNKELKVSQGKLFFKFSPIGAIRCCDVWI